MKNISRTFLPIRSTCPTCKVENKLRIKEDLIYHQEDEETYLYVHFTTCNHIVPAGLISIESETKEIEDMRLTLTPFDKVIEKESELYESTGNLDHYRKILKYNKIKSGETWLLDV